MLEAQRNFDERLDRIGRKHKLMSRGYVTEMRSDGLIIIKPRRRGIDLPVKGMILLFLGVFFFKGFLLASVGPATYDERLATLNSGTVFEQGGAWVMQPDPISLKVAHFIKPIMKF